jgi:hypothetical protein
VWTTPNNAAHLRLAERDRHGRGTFWLQITDALTSRYATSYTGSGTHDGATAQRSLLAPRRIEIGCLGLVAEGRRLGHLHDVPHRQHARRARHPGSNLTVTGANVSTAIPFNATDDFDVYNMHDPAGANPSRITVPIAGKYRVRAAIHTAPSSPPCPPVSSWS